MCEYNIVYSYSRSLERNKGSCKFFLSKFISYFNQLPICVLFCTCSLWCYVVMYLGIV